MNDHSRHRADSPAHPAGTPGQGHANQHVDHDHHGERDHHASKNGPSEARHAAVEERQAEAHLDERGDHYRGHREQRHGSA